MQWSTRIRRPSAADAWLVAAVGSAVALVVDAVLLPWHRSGRARRNAFALARAAHSLGLVTGAPRRLLFVAVYLLPLIVGLAVLAAIAARPRAAGLASGIAGLVGLVAAIVLLRLRGSHQTGPQLACVVASLAIVSGARLVMSRSTA